MQSTPIIDLAEWAEDNYQAADVAPYPVTFPYFVAD